MLKDRLCESLLKKVDSRLVEMFKNEEKPVEKKPKKTKKEVNPIENKEKPVEKKTKKAKNKEKPVEENVKPAKKTKRTIRRTNGSIIKGD